MLNYKHSIKSVIIFGIFCITAGVFIGYYPGFAGANFSLLEIDEVQYIYSGEKVVQTTPSEQSLIDTDTLDISSMEVNNNGLILGLEPIDIKASIKSEVDLSKVENLSAIKNVFTINSKDEGFNSEFAEALVSTDVRDYFKGNNENSDLNFNLIFDLPLDSKNYLAFFISGDQSSLDILGLDKDQKVQTDLKFNVSSSSAWKTGFGHPLESENLMNLVVVPVSELLAGDNKVVSGVNIFTKGNTDFKVIPLKVVSERIDNEHLEAFEDDKFGLVFQSSAYAGHDGGKSCNEGVKEIELLEADKVTYCFSIDNKGENSFSNLQIQTSEYESDKSLLTADENLVLEPSENVQYYLEGTAGSDVMKANLSANLETSESSADSKIVVESTVDLKVIKDIKDDKAQAATERVISDSGVAGVYAEDESLFNSGNSLNQDQADLTSGELDSDVDPSEKNTDQGDPSDGQLAYTGLDSKTVGLVFVALGFFFIGFGVVSSAKRQQYPVLVRISES